MAHIVDTLAGHFTGHVGPVRFKNGHADTADPELVDYFDSQPERYVVEHDDTPTPPAPEGDPDDETDDGED